MTVFPRWAGGVCSLVRSRMKLAGLLSATRQRSGHDSSFYQRNKYFVRGFMAGRNEDTTEVDISRPEGENQGRYVVSEISNLTDLQHEPSPCGAVLSPGIVEILMCRERARNSLGRMFVAQMRELVSGLHHDAAVRVVIFRSLLPGVFCAGADLKERAQMSNSEAERFVHGLRLLMNEIAALPMPTIAAVDGFALGGGLELALACDLRTTAYTAQMGLIETTRGLLPGAGGSQRLPRAVGFAVAKELIFTGRRVGGQQALHLGLVNRAVPQNQSGDAAYREALDLAQEILPQAPLAVRMAKEAMNRGIEVDIASGMAIEGMCYARVIPTKDRQEGMAAFIEKRQPSYTGE